MNKCGSILPERPKRDKMERGIVTGSETEIGIGIEKGTGVVIETVIGKGIGQRKGIGRDLMILMTKGGSVIGDIDRRRGEARMWTIGISESRQRA